MKTLDGDLYVEMRGIAQALMRAERVDHTLQPTALAHEAYLRIGAHQGLARSDFLARAARTMRRLLVDHARKRRAQRRGGGKEPTGQADEVLVDFGGAAGTPPVELIALEEALCQLEEVAPRRARIVELMFFAGLTGRETATVLGIGTTTVEDDWHLARAWLRTRLT